MSIERALEPLGNMAAAGALFISNIEVGGKNEFEEIN